MQITGVSPEQFTQIVARVGAAKYQHNLAAEITSIQSPKRFRARIVPYESGAKFLPVGQPACGARLSWNGQRIKAACWHAFRDVLMQLFTEFPEARVYTSMAKYKGMDGFLANYPPTGHQNIGSMASPVTMPQLCDCEA